MHSAEACTVGKSSPFSEKMEHASDVALANDAWLHSPISENSFLEAQEFAVGHVEARLASAIGATATTLLLSQATYRKQMARHEDILPHMTPEMIQSVLARSEVVREGREGYPRHLVFLRRLETSKFIKLALKSTEDGRFLYLLTFHLVDRHSVDSIRRFGTTLRECEENNPKPLFSSYTIV
eukprot:TRINITY_DN11190_c0_g1_i2.p1 TRINITY_DN11190_c0_g1~~TRINITY_DN11190_c0_g1_i2.p1  ORF type:complete len:182 (+),score=16.62 TRINITY_DN11190_c0_g1_i2:64-609(+)